jgi:hypothetical protein
MEDALAADEQKHDPSHPPAPTPAAAKVRLLVFMD